MNLSPQNNPVAIVSAIVTILGLGGAFVMGRAAANSDYRLIGLVFGAGAAMFIVLTLQNSIWLMIPMCWVLGGRLSWLPIPFSVQQIGVLVAFGIYCVRLAMKRTGSTKAPFNIVDSLLWLNVAIICLMFVRNPVGLNFLGMDTVGGRPYFSVLLGIMAFLVLRSSLAGPKLASYFPVLLLGPSIIVGGLGTITYIFPGLAPLIFPLYSGIDISSYMQDEYYGGGAAGATIQEGRFQSAGNLGFLMITAVVAYVSPTRAISPMAPKYFFIMALGALFVGMAGFRSGLVQTTLTVLLAAYFWERGAGVFRILLAGFVAVVLLLSYQNVADLPNSIQRTLSFLPGPWKEQVKRGAEGSTDWRVEMWEEALTTDKYIKDKIFGNGFGFSREDLAIMVAASFGGQGYAGDVNNKETFMRQGSYHSGPVSSIHFAGVVGLVVFLSFNFALAGYSYKLLLRAWNTPMRPLAIILALTTIYRPFHFIFIFGDYRDDLPSAFFQAGMLKMLENSLIAHSAAALQVTPAPAPTLAEPNRIPLPA